MTYSLNFTSSWERQYKKLDKMTKDRVEEALLIIMERPYTGKALVGNLKGLWSLRIGTNRIIYSIQESEKQVIVQAVGLRKHIYE